jgi:hypothetical protein
MSLPPRPNIESFAEDPLTMSIPLVPGKFAMLLTPCRLSDFTLSDFSRAVLDVFFEATYQFLRLLRNK